MAYKRSALMQQRLNNNRNRILHAARQCVSRGGFRATTMALVAADAGLSTGSIYRYFPSKADLFVSVLQDAVRNEIAVLNAVIQQQSEPRRQLRAAVASFARRALEGPFLAYAFIAEPAEPAVDAERIRARRQFGAVFKSVLQDGIASGVFPQQDALVASSCIVGAFPRP